MPDGGGQGGGGSVPNTSSVGNNLAGHFGNYGFRNSFNDNTLSQLILPEDTYLDNLPARNLEKTSGYVSSNGSYLVGNFRQLTDMANQRAYCAACVVNNLINFLIFI